jgi:hypothetical protein
VPELEFDGERIGQSNSIARFLAREYGLAGKNNIEAAKLDAIIDSSVDMLNGEYFFLSILLSLISCSCCILCLSAG